MKICFCISILGGENLEEPKPSESVQVRIRAGITKRCGVSGEEKRVRGEQDCVGFEEIPV